MDENKIRNTSTPLTSYMYMGKIRKDQNHKSPKPLGTGSISINFYRLTP